MRVMMGAHCLFAPQPQVANSAQLRICEAIDILSSASITSASNQGPQLCASTPERLAMNLATLQSDPVKDSD